MITKLTDAQTAKFDQYVTEWTAKGLTTEQRTLEEAQRDFTPFQTIVLKKDKPAEVILCASPAKCWERVNQVLNPDGKEPLKFIYPYFDCQFWASWFAFYEFCAVELGIEYKNKKEYDAFKACQPYGMVFPLDELCIVCQPPTVIKKNANGLHCENGPALSYTGDNEIYALNGVVMEKWHVMTPAEDIKAEDVMKETNVEKRRELIRKVGIEVLMTAMPHKLLDKRDNYELYSIDLSDTLKDARYLKMVNPSIGVFHLEGVEPGISTVTDALKWRNQNLFENAEVLT